MLDLELYLNKKNVEVLSSFNCVILKYELCILLTENCIVRK